MPTYDDVLEARETIAGAAHRTPVTTSRWVDGLVGARVFFKCESFQRAGAFKFRGAYNAVSGLSGAERRAGVVAHSSGNHAQALALAARLLDVQAVVVMPEGSPQVKVRATRDTYGAEVIFCASSLAARERTAGRLIADRGLTLVHPYDNERVISGAGTAALELLEDVPDLDLLITPVGGGGLLSGTCIAAAGFRESVRVCGAEPERADDARRSLERGRRVENRSADTIADGLRTNLSERTFGIIRDHVEEIVPVSERQILEAMRILWERLKLVVEPSGAVPLAGLLSDNRRTAGERIGVVLSGGNVNLEPFFRAYLPME